MTSMLSIVWDFNPVLVSIGGFEIRYYSLMWAAALFVGGWIFSYFCKKEGRPQELADSAFLYIALGTMIGARATASSMSRSTICSSRGQLLQRFVMVVLPAMERLSVLSPLYGSALARIRCL